MAQAFRKGHQTRNKRVAASIERGQRRAEREHLKRADTKGRRVRLSKAQRKQIRRPDGKRQPLTQPLCALLRDATVRMRCIVSDDATSS